MDALNIGESLSMIRVMTEEEIKERDNNKPEVVELEYVASPWCKTHEWSYDTLGNNKSRKGKKRFNNNNKWK